MSPTAFAKARIGLERVPSLARKEVTQLLKKIRPRDWFDQIEKGLKEYKTFKNNSP